MSNAEQTIEQGALSGSGVGIALLNDTDVNGYHFGCARVVSTIRKQLVDRGLDLAGTVKVGLNWREVNPALIRAADMLIINGEGTLHHGARKGLWMLQAAREVMDRGGKVAIINTLWQDNPAEWAMLIKDADILACRDNRSAARLRELTGRDVRCFGDLSMFGPVSLIERPRQGVLIGDSVHSSTTTKLADFSNLVRDAQLVPVTSSLKFVSPRLSGLRFAARTFYARQKQKQYLLRYPSANFVNNEAAYTELLSTKALSVTGRFHAVCLSVLTRTPFVAISSNSWKIEALIQDIGLNPDRIIPVGKLARLDTNTARWAYTKEEITNIDSFLKNLESKCNALFDDIARMAARDS